MLRASALALFIPLAVTVEFGLTTHAVVARQTRPTAGQNQTSAQPPLLQAAPTTSIDASIPLLAKKKKKKPVDVWVTEAEVRAEKIGETWYYTLRGKVRNRGEEQVTQPIVYYEIYDEQTNTIIDAGTLSAQPSFLAANGGEAIFQKLLSKNGKVKITLVGWRKSDQTQQEHEQLEFFPRPETK